jgi:hypothetical protein
VVAEDVAPAGERQVGRQDQRGVSLLVNNAGDGGRSGI